MPHLDWLANVICNYKPNFTFHYRMDSSQENFQFYVYTRWKCNSSTNNIHSDLLSAWSDKAHDLRTFQIWVTSFKEETCTWFVDAHRNCRPRIWTTVEEKEKIQKTFLIDPHLSIHQLCSLNNDNDYPSKSSVHCISEEMKWLAIWVAQWINFREQGSPQIMRTTTSCIFDNNT